MNIKICLALTVYLIVLLLAFRDNVDMFEHQRGLFNRVGKEKGGEDELVSSDDRGSRESGVSDQ